MKTWHTPEAKELLSLVQPALDRVAVVNAETRAIMDLLLDRLKLEVCGLDDEPPKFIYLKEKK